jgi:hypothetical protein
VYVLRDLMGEASQADAPPAQGPRGEFSREEIEELKRRLKKLGYL